MAEFRSKKAVVSKAPYELYMAFVDMRNFVQFLPEDKKADVTADYDSIHAVVQGFSIGVRVKDRVPYSKIEFSAVTNPVAEGEDVPLNETTFYKKQHRVALRNCGVIDPENVSEYIAMDGYTALGKVLTTMTPDEVIQLVTDSGLRGRGGGGFPTGRKWLFASSNRGQILEIIAGRPEGFLVLSGNDDETFPLMKAGADGVISVASNIAPVPVAKLAHAMMEGKIEKAAGLHEKLSPLFRNCFVESNPIPAKAALAAMGMMQNELRLPLVPSQQKTYDLMVETVKDLGLL